MSHPELRKFLKGDAKIRQKILKYQKRMKKLEKKLEDYAEIYIIKCNQFYKIGRSFNPYKRLKDIQVSNPYQLNIIYSQQVKNAPKMERKIHRYFKEKRARGEWFKLNKEEIKTIIKWIKKEYPE